MFIQALNYNPNPLSPTSVILPYHHQGPLWSSHLSQFDFEPCAINAKSGYPFILAVRSPSGQTGSNWATLHSTGESSLAPKSPAVQTCHAYDVADNLSINPNSRTNLNPPNGWRFRHNPNEDPERNPSILGMVMIGKVLNDVPYDDIEARLASLPLPDKDVQPVQNCVTWTMAAIGKLQEIGVAGLFDIRRFMDDAMMFADRRIRDTTQTPREMNYTRQTM